RTVIPHFGAGHQRVTHPFATRILSYCYKSTSFDLHVLGTPPAFILSQDQTLRKKFFTLASVVYGLTGLTKMLFLITLQLLRCSSCKTVVFRINRRKHRCCPSHRLRQTAKRACSVSLTRDGYSVVNGSVVGTRSVSDVLATRHYMFFHEFVNSCQTNLP